MLEAAKEVSVEVFFFRVRPVTSLEHQRGRRVF